MYLSYNILSYAGNNGKLRECGRCMHNQLEPCEDESISTVSFLIQELLSRETDLIGLRLVGAQGSTGALTNRRGARYDVTAHPMTPMTSLAT